MLNYSEVHSNTALLRCKMELVSMPMLVSHPPGGRVWPTSKHAMTQQTDMPNEKGGGAHSKVCLSVCTMHVCEAVLTFTTGGLSQQWRDERSGRKR